MAPVTRQLDLGFLYWVTSTKMGQGLCALTFIMVSFHLSSLTQLLLFAADISAHGSHGLRESSNGTNPAALNPQLTTTFPLNGGPELYYNGSGPVPPYNQTSPLPVPITPLNSTSAIEDAYFQELLAITGNSSSFSECNRCIVGTEIFHLVSITQPVTTVTNLLIRLCNVLQWDISASTCEQEYSGIGGTGPYYAQLFSKMSYATGDMQAWCFYQWDTCTQPPTVEIDESQYFSPKPAKANVAPTPSGQTINVLHLSDWHLDPRYDIGSEANCSQYLCCRPYSTNTGLDTNYDDPSVPASRFGYLYCDSPPDLALSSFASMERFFGGNSNLSFTIFTGDIISHDNGDQLSRAYIEYEERVTYETFKANMGNVPVYPTLGNHDSFPVAFNTPNSFAPTNALSWNYELLSSMWQRDGWLNSSEASYASTHYGGYAHTTEEGLRIISINTDFWYTANIFNYFNFTNPDHSGSLAWLARELQACEDAGQRAWIIGHVPSGYDGTQALPNPSALFQSIVVRFSPATVAGVFFGHTHQDQLQLFYDYAPASLSSSPDGSRIRNTTAVDHARPLTPGFIGPSVTPLAGNNAGYRLYQVDAATFSVTGIQTFFANVSNSLAWSAPRWEFEYDARDTYAVGSLSSWPAAAPLNATFWDGVAREMLANRSLVQRYNLLETKSSVVTEPCDTSACARQKVCYIRSGSAAVGNACSVDDGSF